MFWTPTVFEDRVAGDEAHRRLWALALAPPPVGSAHAPSWPRSCQGDQGAIPARDCIAIIAPPDALHAQVPLWRTVSENRTSGGRGVATFRNAMAQLSWRASSRRAARYLSGGRAKRQGVIPNCSRKPCVQFGRLRPRNPVTSRGHPCHLRPSAHVSPKPQATPQFGLLPTNAPTKACQVNAEVLNSSRLFRQAITGKPKCQQLAW